MFFVGWFVGSALGIVTTVIVASITSSNRDSKDEEVQEEETKVTHEKSEVPCQINRVNAEEIRGVKSMDHLIQQVEEWARVRKLDTADPKAQALKIVEEFTEMVLAFDDFKTNGEDDASYEFDEVVDGIGDTYVTLIILCQQLDIDFISALSRGDLMPRMGAVEVLNYLSTTISKNSNHGVEYAVMCILKIANRFARYINVKPIDCLSIAYNEIKDRKGMMIDSTFVKYDDLSTEQKAVLDNA